MWKHFFTVLFGVVCLQALFFSTIFARMKFKKLRCNVADPTFGKMITCRIRADSRNSSTVLLHGILHRNVYNTTVRVRLMRWLSGWRPFLFDFKMNPCTFIKQPDKYFFAHLCWIYARIYANLTDLHPCPYLAGEELFISIPDINERVIQKYIPVYHGEYGLFFDIYINNTFAGDGMASVVFEEDFKPRTAGTDGKRKRKKI